MRDRSTILSVTNTLADEKRAQVVSLVVEGMSIRAVVRVSDVANGTVLKLLPDLGTACATYRDVEARAVRRDLGVRG